MNITSFIGTGLINKAGLSETLPAQVAPSNPIAKVALNPQPLPPRVGFDSPVNNADSSLKYTRNLFPHRSVPPTDALNNKMPIVSGYKPPSSVVATSYVFGKPNEVDQLKKADDLMQDAFQKASDPNFNNNIVGQQQIKEEIDQAHKIRASVAEQLSPYQQDALWQIDSEERAGIDYRERGLDGQLLMQDGAQQTQSLNNWILSE
jgi:hypothetical protein